QTVTAGKELNGMIPMVVKASSVSFPAIKVGALACACVRAQASKTCGGILQEKNGTRATDCTPVFTRGDIECTGLNPCTFVHGAGNASSGFVGCNGLSNTSLMFTQDSGGVAQPPPPTPMIGGGPPIITLGDSCACAANADCTSGFTCNTGTG